MNVLKEIDEKASINQGKEILTNYRRLSRIAGVKLYDPDTPMFKEISADNEYKAMLVEINKAISMLKEVSLEVIFYTYCSSSKLTHYQLGNRVGYAQGSIDRLLIRAISEFVECYKQGELLVYK